jgi:DNA-binding CsgD family transcriptional regulator
VYYKDAATKHGNVYYNCGRRDPHYKRLYLQDYCRIDPTTVGLWLRETGKPLGIRDIMDIDEFHASRFYQEWVRPQKHVDAVSVTLDKTATGAALFTVFRHERHGFLDAEARWRMGLIAPHVRRAALVGRALEHKTAEAATLADTFDGLSAAMFLVDADGRVVHANAAGEAMLRQSLVLSVASGKLAASDAVALRALNEMVAAAKGGDAAAGSRGIAVPLTARDGERYVVHALPLASAERGRAGGGCAAVAALFVQKAALQLRSLPEVVAKTFNLTPTELRVLLAIVETGGVPETAEALGIGQATVKTHLHRLFGKTDTRRQADLVKLMAAFANPLAD